MPLGLEVLHLGRLIILEALASVCVPVLNYSCLCMELLVFKGVTDHQRRKSTQLLF